MAINWRASLADGERRLRRRRSSLLVLGILAGACGQTPEAAPPAQVTDPSVSTTSTTSSGAEQATGTTKKSQPPATGKQDPGAGLGAPFDVPAIVASQGFDEAEARSSAETVFAKRCGADPCRVRFDVVKPKPDPTRAHCDIVFSGRTDPKAGSKVRRGSVVKLIFMYSPGCDPETPTTETTDTTADGNQQGTGGDHSGDDGSGGDGSSGDGTSGDASTP